MDWWRNVDAKGFAALHSAFGRGDALGRILALVEDAGCKTVAIDYAPSENEYRKEHEVFYSRVFGMEEKIAPTRLSFFRGDLSAELDVKDSDPRYLGYCDIRPTLKPSISYSLIDRSVFVKDKSRHLFLICQREFTVDFGERKLKVRAFPYVQQDGVVIRCAQAALTSVAHYFGVEKTGPEFTDIGARISSGMAGSSVPNNGLTPHQMALGIEAMQRDPVIYDCSITDASGQPRRSEQIIYRYLESGIPVLLGIQAGDEMHAVVVVGHTFSPDSWFAQTSTKYYRHKKTGGSHHCSTNWVEKFIIQDDNLGPYTVAPSALLQTLHPVVMVPLVPNVHLKAEDAERFVGNFFDPHGLNGCARIDGYIDRFCSEQQIPPADRGNLPNTFWYEEFRRHALGGSLILRTSLRSSDDWKASMTRASCYTELGPILTALPVPERVWVVEISWESIFLHGRRFAGEMVLDPTCTIERALSPGNQAWLWIHVPGVAVTRDAKTLKRRASVFRSEDAIREHHLTCG